MSKSLEVLDPWRSGLGLASETSPWFSGEICVLDVYWVFGIFMNFWV